MAVYSGPEIVNSGLVLHLDAANSRSYPGTGTAWNDISGNNRNALLLNGPTYSAGSIVFDATDDSTTFSYSQTGSNNTTMELWYRWNGTNYQKTLLYLGDGGTTGHGFLMHDGSGSGIGNKVGILYGGTYWNAINTGVQYATLVAGKWCQLVVARDNTITSLYQNGALLGTTTRTPNGLSSNLSLVGDFKDARAASVRVYNRALTASEIKQNFEATRGRYGI